MWGEVVNYVTKGQTVDNLGTVGNITAGKGIFVSRFTHTLDPKKRLTIPSDWRIQVMPENSFYVLPDVQSKCLVVFPIKEMERRMEKLRNHAMSDQHARQFARVLAAQSDLVQWDSQGRIRIKDELLDFADLKEVVELVSAFDRFELWSPDRYAENQKSGTSIADAATYVGF